MPCPVPDAPLNTNDSCFAEETRLTPPGGKEMFVWKRGSISGEGARSKKAQCWRQQSMFRELHGIQGP